MTRPRLLLEPLEDRTVPTVWGIPWANPSHLTISFVPDGTLVSGQHSNLFSTLNRIAPTAAWEHTILQAFQSWAVNANINVAVVPDDGDPLGTPGRPQGDPRFGDIRIAAVPLSPQVSAYTAPFNVMAGRWSGDMLLNSSTAFSMTGTSGEDLMTVVLHEAGHSFSLPDNSNSSSVMDATYLGVRRALTAGDVSALQALYGARALDSANNANFATATSLGSFSNSGGVLALQANGDLGTPGDKDYYRFSAPSGLASLTITLQRSGLSLLTPQLNVYNARYQLVASAVSTDPLGGDLTIHLNGVVPSSTYYVEVQGSTQDVFSIGSYQLQVQSVPLVNQVTGLLGSLLGPVVSPVVNIVTAILPLNLSFLTATVLGLGQVPQNDQHANYTDNANILYSGQVAYYSVEAPPVANMNVMTVTVWGTANNGLLPSVHVYDANHNLVPAQVLVNENGIVTLQLANATPGATYFVTVSAAQSSGPGSTGGYFLAINFGPQALQLDTVAQGSLSPTQPQQTGVLDLPQAALYHFVLSAQGSANAQVSLTITSASGVVVAQLTAVGGSAESVTLTLAPGKYQLVYTGSGLNGKPLSPIDYLLSGVMLTNPIGPQPMDPTEAPSQSAAPPPSSSTSTSSTSPSTGSPSSAPPSNASPTSPTSGSTSTTSSSSTASSSSTGSSSSAWYTYYYSDPYSSGYQAS
jgi:hypothetical protein